MRNFISFLRVSFLWKTHLYVWLILLAFASSSFAQKERIKSKKTNFGMGYLEYLPGDYSHSNEKYPVIIYLHGRGEQGNGKSQLSKVKKWGPLHKIDQGSDMCFTVNGKKNCFIVIGPQTSRTWNVGTVDKLIDYVTRTYRVDPDRVYLTGLSLGGIGTWNYSYSDANGNNKLAAIAPVAGAGDPKSACAIAKNKIAVWAFHGKKDHVISYKKSKEIVDALKGCNPNPSPGLTLYNTMSHNGKMWERAYDDKHTYQSPNLYEWFLKQKRGKGSQSPPPPSNKNQSPVAHAGGDLHITYPNNSVVLNGNKSKDPDGKIKRYQWVKKSGPSANIKKTASASTPVKNLKAGSYIFALTVTDKQGATNTDVVKVVVNNKNTGKKDKDEDKKNTSGGNSKLIADAGNDQVIPISDNSIVLDGRKSKISGGEIVDYRWEKLKGSINFRGIQKGNVIRVDNLRKGSYIFELTVVDNKGNKATDRVNIEVNVPPVADAGKNVMVSLPNNSVTLNGRRSKDKDGKVVKYEWEKLKGPINFLGTKNGAVQQVKDMRPGSYVFKLTVVDNHGSVSSDRINVIVKDNGRARTVTVNNKKVSETSKDAIAATLPEAAINRNTVIKAYPNPVGSSLTVDLTSDMQGKVTIELISMDGRIFFTKAEIVADGQNTLALDLSGIKINPGTFFLRIENEGGTGKTLKMIKY